eukprot:2732288-Rhodomonas_salina.2
MLQRDRVVGTQRRGGRESELLMRLEVADDDACHPPRTAVRGRVTQGDRDERADVARFDEEEVFVAALEDVVHRGVAELRPAPRRPARASELDVHAPARPGLGSVLGERQHLREEGSGGFRGRQLDGYLVGDLLLRDATAGKPRPREHRGINCISLKDCTERGGSCTERGGYCS